MIDDQFYTPSSIVSILNASISIKEEKKIIKIRGVFLKTGNSNYGGSFYNRIKDEAGENSITLITPMLLHNQLVENKTIELNGFITRKSNKQGQIDISINLIELISQKANIFSEEDIKKIDLINKKIQIGFKDLDAHIKNCIFNNKQISIQIVIGKSSIIDSDIKRGLAEATSLYKIDFHRVSLSSPDEIMNKINYLETLDTDVICIARGGGENLNVFESISLCEQIINRKKIIASAIGHAEDVTLFEKLSDKKFITPTQFGNYLKEIYNNAVEELSNSKAKLTKDITSQLTANFGKQIQNLNEQLLATKELSEKSKTELIKNYSDQLINAQNKLKSFEEINAKSLKEKNDLYLTEVENYKKQITHLNNQFFQSEKMMQQSNNLVTIYQRQKSSNFLKVFITIVIALIVGLIIGLAIH